MGTITKETGPLLLIVFLSSRAVFKVVLVVLEWPARPQMTPFNREDMVFKQAFKTTFKQPYFKAVLVMVNVVLYLIIKYPTRGLHMVFLKNTVLVTKKSLQTNR